MKNILSSLHYTFSRSMIDCCHLQSFSKWSKTRYGYLSRASCFCHTNAPTPLACDTGSAAALSSDNLNTPSNYEMDDTDEAPMAAEEGRDACQPMQLPSLDFGNPFNGELLMGILRDVSVADHEARWRRYVCLMAIWMRTGVGGDSWQGTVQEARCGR
jgi:hypothetical protein